MKAGRIHAYGGPEQLVYEDAPQPHPMGDQVLIHVYGSGVTPTELSWFTTWKTKTGADRQLQTTKTGASDYRRPSQR